MTSTTGAVVAFEHVTKRYAGGAADPPAVHDLTFTTDAGAICVLVGPSGCGKTTTLRMLAGVLPPTSGDAELLGVRLSTDAERVKPRIAYMAQRFGLYHDLTVRENLHFYADLYRVPRAERGTRMERLYGFSNLAPFKDRLAGQLEAGAGAGPQARPREPRGHRRPGGPPQAARSRLHSTDLRRGEGKWEMGRLRFRRLGFYPQLGLVFQVG